MNFRQIEAFNAVMAVGTTTGAADLLNVSQPAISRLISQLEQAASLKLFNRSKGRLVPTQEGLLFHREVARSFSVLERLKTAAADIRSHGTGSVRIAALPALGFSLVPHAVSAFLRQHVRHVSAVMEIGSSDTVREAISSGQFDIGFAADEIETSGILAETFATPTAVCILPKGHPLAKKALVEAADIQGQPFVSLSRTDSAYRRISAVLEAAGVEPKVMVETHFALSIGQLVAGGTGVGLINPFSLEGISPERVDVRPFRPAVQFRTLMIFPPQRPVSELTSSFARIAQAAAEPFLAQVLGRFGLNLEQLIP
jgi:DNA-binding transcriptional LysR family regulator